MDAPEPAAPSQFELLRSALKRKYQHLLDQSTVYVSYRWAGLLVLLGLYCVRVWFVNGFFVVSYGLGLFILNQFIGFISPPIDPETEGPVLPSSTREAEEYRPFQRQVPEFKFWLNCVGATLLAMTLTLSRVFDLPVFWPILVLYFFVLMFVSMQKRILHMWKHKYIPCDCGKRTYGGKGGKGAKFTGAGLTR